MRTTYILDTSALVTDPYAYKSFAHSDIIIPITVLNELDKLKKQNNDAGKKARVAIRLLDEISSKGDISTGVLWEDDVLIKVDTEYNDLKGSEYAGFGDPEYGDTQILVCALKNLKLHPEGDVIFVSNDINLRIKAKSRGLSAIAHESNRYSFSDLFSGAQVIKDEFLGLELQKRGSLDGKEYNILLLPNEFVSFEDVEGNVIALGRQGIDGKIRLVKKQYPWNIAAKNKEQSFAMDLIMDKNVDLVTFIGKAGTGKSLVTLASAMELVLNRNEYDKFVIYRPIQPVGNDIGYLPGPQPLDAKVATPNGWTTMGELKSGDYVISRDGTPSKVLKVFPKGKKEVFRITTTDGTSTEACGDHPWSVKSLNDRKNGNDYRIVSTKEMQNSLKANGAFNYHLPRNEAVQFTKKELPIPAYSLGAYLGDGSSDDHFTIYSKDQEIIKRVEKELSKFDVYVSNQKSNKLSHRFYPNKQIGKSGANFVLATNMNDGSFMQFNSISDAANYFQMNASSISRLCRNGKISKNYSFKYLDQKMNSSNPIVSQLKNMGLSGKKSWEKYIPETYKYSSIDDRVNLLRGLMDTDGTIKQNGECSFTTTSKQLAEDIIEVVRSLGGRASLCKRDRVGKSNQTKGLTITARRASYEFTISLPNNTNPFYLKRKSERFNKNKNIKPLAVKSVESIGHKEVQCILIDNPEHLYLTNNFIVTHNTMEEKLGPWFQAIMDNMEALLTPKGKGKKIAGEWRKNLDMFMHKGQIEMEAITYIRGRSIPNAIIMVDEAQNLSKEEIKTILTRAGEGTKIILTGDIEQIDNSGLDATNNGLTYVIEMLKESELTGHVTFIQGERSRLATKVAEVL